VNFKTCGAYNHQFISPYFRLGLMQPQHSP